MDMKSSSESRALSAKLYPAGARHPQLGLGCNAIGHVPDDAAAKLVKTALDHGVRLFDTANIYADGRSEETLGRLLPPDRSDLFIVTKFGHPATVAADDRPCSAVNVRRSIDSSLSRLKSDSVTCAVIHFPDPKTPFEETLDAVSGLISEGKIEDYGVSNFGPEDFSRLLETADLLGVGYPIVVQEEYNLLHRTRALALLAQLDDRGMELMPFFPLASGLLTGKYRGGAPASPYRSRIVRGFEARFLDDRTTALLAEIDKACAEFFIPMLGAALAWLKLQPCVGPIIVGATSDDQLAANFEAFGTELPTDFLDEIDRILKADRDRVTLTH